MRRLGSLKSQQVLFRNPSTVNALPCINRCALNDKFAENNAPKSRITRNNWVLKLYLILSPTYDITLHWDKLSDNPLHIHHTGNLFKSAVEKGLQKIRTYKNEKFCSFRKVKTNYHWLKIATRRYIRCLRSFISYNDEPIFTG